MTQSVVVLDMYVALDYVHIHGCTHKISSHHLHGCLPGSPQHQVSPGLLERSSNCAPCLGCSQPNRLSLDSWSQIGLRFSSQPCCCLCIRTGLHGDPVWPVPYLAWPLPTHLLTPLQPPRPPPPSSLLPSAFCLEDTSLGYWRLLPNLRRVQFHLL